MEIGKYFTLEEMTKTSSNLDNTPNEIQLDNLKALVEFILDPIREIYGKPITVNSGYRSMLVNRRAGGTYSSQHKLGQAADITCDDNKKLFEIIKEYCKFDQLINERNYRWIHVSYNKNKNRNEILKFTGKKYIKLN